MTEPTAAEIEAAARVLADHVNDGPAWLDMSHCAREVWRDDAAAALAAALPLVEARLREQIAGEHGAEIKRLTAENAQLWHVAYTAIRHNLAEDIRAALSDGD